MGRVSLRPDGLSCRFHLLTQLSSDTYFEWRLPSLSGTNSRITKELEKFKERNQQEDNWGAHAVSHFVTIFIYGSFFPAYPVALLHVAVEFLTDVRLQVEDIIMLVENQTNDFQVPYYDIFLPTEGDFERLKLEMAELWWLVPEAIDWPGVLRSHMVDLPLTELSIFKGDFEEAAGKYVSAMREFLNTHDSLVQWMRAVEQEHGFRDMKAAFV